MRKGLTLTLIATIGLVLSACSGDADTKIDDESEGADRSFDVSQVEVVEEIAELVPDAIRDDGTLVIGASIDYAPAEFRADDLQTAIGYDVDLSKALGKVLDLEVETSSAEFASILPGIGTKYDLGISSFTINDERTANYNMISYINVGSSFAVKAGNPDGFDPESLCGESIGVQNGTVQQDDLEDKSAECSDAGEEAIDVVVYGTQSDVTTNVVGGKIIAMFADSTVSGYSVAMTNDQLEVVGDVIDSAPQGIVVAQDDEELTEAVLQATQHLMDEGVWDDILNSWGAEDAALDEATVFPEK